MYIPKPFRLDDEAALFSLIADHPLATLIVSNETGLEANHLPLALRENPDGSASLVGHVARANSVWRNESYSEALAIFSGPQCYVSPSAYPSKTKDGKVVPTWNYVAVHVSGQIRFVDDPEWKRSVVRQLTVAQESGRASAWAIEDAPESYLERMLVAIVGLEIDIRSISGKAKLSQNQTSENRAGVISQLETEGRVESAAMLAAMRATEK